MQFQNTRDFAKQLDKKDPLSTYKKEFYFPQVNGKNVVYFTGNSLGLQSKSTQKYVDEVMEDWKNLGVDGHFHARKPWVNYHERLIGPLAKVVGAKQEEVTVMNTLTVNLHLLMVSFYRPTKSRFKIICEEKAFPSDQYMLASQIRFHGFKPEESIIEIKKRDGEHFWRTEDIIDKVNEIGDELALILMGGVNYYNGQVFNMEAITKAGHNIGAKVGWDLAHAAGNVKLELNKWKVDFAAWCSYKYMNSGPGHVSGIYINEKYHNKKDIPRFEGWWGHDKERRFLMEPKFQPMPNVEAWQLSNPPILSVAPYLASLEMFEKAGIDSIVEKSKMLTSYLEFILKEIDKEVDSGFEIITPKERGAQLSVFLHGEGKSIFDYLMKNGVITDWREPNVIRLAPAPLYCSFEDMYEFGEILKKGILQDD